VVAVVVVQLVVHGMAAAAVRADTATLLAVKQLVVEVQQNHH
jgi:hypothetical protein